MKNITALLLALSGFSAFIYQLAWLRLLGLSIGMTSTSLVTIVAVIFTGMALGSWLSGRLSYDRLNRLKVFSLLQLVVVVSGLVLLPILFNLDHLMAEMPALASLWWFKYSVTMVLLVVPAACMGAAYPLLVAALTQQQAERENNIAYLYALHTSGGVAGALMTVFALIPWWGLDGAVYFAAGINIVVAVIAYRLATSMPVQIEQGHLTQDVVRNGSKLGLIVLFVLGMSAVSIEISWSKYLIIFGEGTFSTLVVLFAIFLFGIALGSITIGSIVKRVKSPRLWLMAGLLVLGAMIFSSRSWMIFIPIFDEYIKGLMPQGQLQAITRYLGVVIVMMPVTFLLGALFSLSLRYYSGTSSLFERRIANGYALNILAGVVGLAIAGLGLIPESGAEHILVLVALLVTFTALLFWSNIQSNRNRNFLVTSVVVIVLIGPILPKLDYMNIANHMDDYRRKIGKVFPYRGNTPHYNYLAEGESLLVSLATYDDGMTILKKDGIEEAYFPTNEDRGSVLMGLLPRLLHTSAKSSMVIGYGGGTTVNVLEATPLESIKIVELEPGIVDAMASYIGSEKNIFNDPRITIEYNDPRNILLLDDKRYDIITTHPSLPWRVGGNALNSKKFFQLVRSRLTEGGVFSHWYDLNQTSVRSMKSILKAFYEVFPSGSVFIERGRKQLILIGTEGVLELDRNDITKLLSMPTLKLFANRIAITKPEDIFKFYLMNRTQALELAGGVPGNSDLNFISEMQFPRGRNVPQTEGTPWPLLIPYLQQR